MIEAWSWRRVCGRLTPEIEVRRRQRTEKPAAEAQRRRAIAQERCTSIDVAFLFFKGLTHLGAKYLSGVRCSPLRVCSAPLRLCGRLFSSLPPQTLYNPKRARAVKTIISLAP